MHPLNYAHSPAYTDDAYDELSAPAFAVWIRLMTFSFADFREGLGAISKRLGYRPKGGRVVLDELERNGYIGFVTSGRIVQVVLLRKAMVDLRGTNFIRGA